MTSAGGGVINKKGKKKVSGIAMPDTIEQLPKAAHY